MPKVTSIATDKPVVRPVEPLASSTATAVMIGTLSLADVKRQWDEMTAAVQEGRTYLGACLLEGKPVSFLGKTLTMAFSEACTYQKECLEETEAMRLVADVFSKILGREIVVSFVIEQGVERDPSGALQSALDSFQGEVINEWHNEDK